MVVTSDKEPVMVHISEGSIHDVRAGYKFMQYLPKESIAIGDKGVCFIKVRSFFLNDLILYYHPLGVFASQNRIC
ncbi:MAG: hypothetical protein KA253_04670 [Campylobacteraceae bacterium]|nr:hypothetical protein [Campylobacteraceae bacterium]